MSNLHTRRTFLNRGLTVLSAAATMPLFLQRTVLAMNRPGDIPLTQAAAGRGDDRILIVIQLAGGNDGLATVIPRDNDDYRRARPTLAVAQNTLSLGRNSDVDLHPNLRGFKSLYDAGELAVIQGVGYPNPNRSHFRATEIWQTADPTHPPVDGWIGRYFDSQCKGADPIDPKSAIQIGPHADLMLHGEKFSAISFQNPNSYQWFAGKRIDSKTMKTFQELNNLHNDDGTLAVAPTTGNPTLDFLERTALDAQLSSAEIRAVTTKYHGGVSYPNTPFGQQLQMVAQMIAGGLSTRVYYVSLGGFDNHTNEANQHDKLMTTLSDGVSSLMIDLKAQGNDKRTLLMTFSEFGRRVGENASRGTDHGTAAPMFLIGGPVKGQVVGTQPSLRPQDLDHGDLRFHTDFRSVYATILKQHLNTDPNEILGRGFQTLPII